MEGSKKGWKAVLVVPRLVAVLFEAAVSRRRDSALRQKRGVSRDWARVARRGVAGLDSEGLGSKCFRAGWLPGGGLTRGGRSWGYKRPEQGIWGLKGAGGCSRFADALCWVAGLRVDIFEFTRTGQNRDSSRSSMKRPSVHCQRHLALLCPAHSTMETPVITDPTSQLLANASLAKMDDLSTYAKSNNVPEILQVKFVTSLVTRSRSEEQEWHCCCPCSHCYCICSNCCCPCSP